MIGQGEVLIYEFLLNNLPASQKVYTESDIYEKRLDISSTYIANYSDIDLSNYLYLGATSSTGCLYKCSFCNVMEFFGPYKSKDVVQTVNELELLKKLYKIRNFFFTDHMINPIVNNLSIEIAKRELDIYWTAYLRVDKNACNKENARKWRKGGMYCAKIGIESGSQNVLDLMGKRISPSQSKLVLKNLANAGIKTTAYFVIGHPGETEDDFRQTLQFLDEVKDYIWEAECDYFNYNYSGQSDSTKWAALRKLVYPKSARNLLICQKWKS